MADRDGTELPSLVTLKLDGPATARLAEHAEAAGISVAHLAARWVLQRLEVEDDARAARGGGTEQLLRLLKAIEEVEPPEG